MKKGFTIVEIIASIAIVLIITVIAVPNILKISDENKIKVYEGKINLALSAAEEYGNDYIDTLTSTCTAITIGDLINLGYIKEEENGKIYDPRNNEQMNNIWICITYENNKINTYLRGE